MEGLGAISPLSFNVAEVIHGGGTNFSGICRAGIRTE
jgi:hypothetical protein